MHVDTPKTDTMVRAFQPKIAISLFGLSLIALNGCAGTESSPEFEQAVAYGAAGADVLLAKNAYWFPDQYGMTSQGTSFIGVPSKMNVAGTRVYEGIILFTDTDIRFLVPLGPWPRGLDHTHRVALRIPYAEVRDASVAKDECLVVESDKGPDSFFISSKGGVEIRVNAYKGLSIIKDNSSGAVN